MPVIIYVAGINVSVHVHGFCPEDTLSTAQPFVTKPGVMMHHHLLQCHVTRLGCCLQGHGHSDGLYCLNVTVSTGSSNNPFAFNCSLVVDHHKLKCSVKVLDYCIHGQGHSNCSKIVQ